MGLGNVERDPYVFEDVVDHLLDLVSRHSFGMLGGLDDIGTESLDICGQPILRGVMSKEGRKGARDGERDVRHRSGPFR